MFYTISAPPTIGPPCPVARNIHIQTCQAGCDHDSHITLSATVMVIILKGLILGFPALRSQINQCIAQYATLIAKQLGMLGHGSDWIQTKALR